MNNLSSANDLRTAYTGRYPQCVRDACSSYRDGEAELLYAVTHVTQPRFIVEIGLGWTTQIMLSALPADGQLLTYAIDPWAAVPVDPRFTWVQGDARKTWKIPSNDIDLLLIDAEHSADFAHWCQATLLPLIQPQIPVMIHDWLPGRPGDWNTEEATAWDEWFEENKNAWNMYYAFGWNVAEGLSSVWLWKHEDAQSS